MRLTGFTSGMLLQLLVVLLAGCAALQTTQGVGTTPPPSEPTSPQAAQELALAEEAFRQGNLDVAAEAYEHVVSAYPGTVEATKALLRQGEIEFRQEHYDRAVSRFQDVVSRTPLGPQGREARLWLLRCYVKLGRFNDAVESGRSLVSFLTEKAQRAEVSELVGDANASLGRHAEAVRWYARAYPLVSGDGAGEVARKAATEVKYLDQDTVAALLSEYPDSFPYLLLQTRAVELEIESGQLESAGKRLQGLMAKAPMDPLAETWMAMSAKVRAFMDVDMKAVGCVLPLSGRYKGYGDQVLSGIGMAAQGAGAGHPGIRLVVNDGGEDPATTAAAVRELALTEKVAAIIGPLSRQAAEAAAKEAQELQIPIITLTQNRGIGQIGDYVFRDFLSNEQQVRDLAEYAVLGLGLRRFAILYPQDAYGSRLTQLFTDAVIRLGGEIRGVEAYDPSQTDFANQIKSLLGLGSSHQKVQPSEVGLPGETAEGPDERQEQAQGSGPEATGALDFEAIFIPDGYEKVGLIAPQLAYYDLTGVRLLGTNLWNSPKLLEMAAPYLDGAVFVDGFFANSQRSLTRQFVQTYQEAYGKMPDYPEAQGYDATRLVMTALEEPGVTNRQRLREALLAIHDLPGVEGTATMTPVREVERESFFITVRKGRMAEIPVDLKALEKSGAALAPPAGPNPRSGLSPESGAPVGSPSP
jgi:branched-chain amino acid transport system substrate-binding protein